MEFFEKNYGVFKIKNYGEVVFEFMPEAAPNHCERIKHLIEIDYYDGKTFHRLAALQGPGKGRIIQGGSLNGQGVAGHTDGVTLKLEANAPNDKGTIGMARTRDPNSANSQFWFNLDANNVLDKQYTVWGKIVDGMDLLEKVWKENYIGDSAGPKNTLVIEEASFRPKEQK